MVQLDLKKKKNSDYKFNHLKRQTTPQRIVSPVFMTVENKYFNFKFYHLKGQYNTFSSAHFAFYKTPHIVAVLFSTSNQRPIDY
jgi:hypothetical protein